jgi:hypothetical protein
VTERHLPEHDRPEHPIESSDTRTGRREAAGALADTLAVVDAVRVQARRTADRVGAIAEQLDAEAATLLGALGGGPPQRLRDTQGMNRSAVGDCRQAAAALTAAADALGAFAHRYG